MSRDIIEVLVLGVIALVVLSRLYATLGRRTGSDAPPAARVKPASGPAEPVTAGLAPVPAAAPRPAAEGGVADIQRADPSFDVSHFVAGARAAYEMIVQAFAAGDRAALKPLLTPPVFDSYDKAITAREGEGGKGPELVRLKNAELAEAQLDGRIARATVRFEAELAEGAHGLRDTKERWVFERDVTSRDPNWRLAAVAQG